MKLQQTDPQRSSVRIVMITVACLWASLSGLLSRVEAGEYVVSGEVTAADGSIVPMAKVRVSQIDIRPLNGVQLTPDGQWVSPLKPLEETATDPAGRFRVVLPDECQIYAIWMTDPVSGLTCSHVFHRKPGNSLPSETAVNLKLQMSRTSKRQVRVSDTQGNPIAGAKVFRLDLRGMARGVFGSRFPETETTECGLTNEEGVLTVAVADDVLQWLWIRKQDFVTPGVLLTPQSFEEANSDWMKFHKQTALAGVSPIEFRLTSGGSLTGRVVSQTGGDVIADAQVFLEFEDYKQTAEERRKGQLVHFQYWAQSDSQGRFQIPELPAAVYNVVVWKDGQFAIHPSISLTEGSRQSLGDLPLKPGYRIHGQVWDLDSRLPANIEGGRVVARHDRLGEFSGAVRENGQFEILAPPEPYLQTTVYLADHPLWKEFKNPNSTSQVMRRGQQATEYTLTVERKEPPLRDEELPGELAKFREEYRLAPGQWVKRVPRPFSRAREAFYQIRRLPEEIRPDWVVNPYLSSLPRWATPQPSPTYSVMIVDALDRFYLPSTWRNTASISDVIVASQIALSRNRSGLMNFRANQIPLKSDFVVRRGAPFDAFVEALNQELQKEPPIPLQVELKDEKFLALKVTKAPDEADLKKVTQFRFVPDSYTGKVNQSHFYGDWQLLISSVCEHHLGLEAVSVEAPKFDFNNVVIETPFYTPLKLSGRTREDEALDQKNREELQKQTQIVVLKFLRDLGAEATVEEISLPVVHFRLLSNAR